MSTACAEGTGDAGATIEVELAWSPGPRQVQRLALRLPAGTTLEGALQASGWPAANGWSVAELRVGIWGKVKALDTPLRERDRVEVYRPLRVDPKEARRQRYRKQHDSRPAAGGKGNGPKAT